MLVPCPPLCGGGDCLRGKLPSGLASASPVCQLLGTLRAASSSVSTGLDWPVATLTDSDIPGCSIPVLGCYLTTGVAVA